VAKAVKKIAPGMLTFMARQIKSEQAKTQLLMTSMQMPKRYWGKQKAQLKAMFPQLEDADFDFAYGEKEKMMERLQMKTGKTRSDLNGLIIDLRSKKKIYKIQS
jgi:hypothetical protein